MISKRILRGDRLDDSQLEQILDQFYQDGFSLIPGVLTEGEIRAIREVTDRCFNDPVLVGTDYTSGNGDGFVLRNTIELDPIIKSQLDDTKKKNLRKLDRLTEGDKYIKRFFICVNIYHIYYAKV